MQASVAEAPQVHCAQAIAARLALADLLKALNRPSLPLSSLRQGVRLIVALCADAGEAREVDVRRSIRFRLYDNTAPLLYGAFGQTCLNDEAQAAPAIATALAAFASEPELALRLGSESGGAALRLACDLARSSSASARASAIDAIYACAAASDDNVWKLVGFGALDPLLVASSAVPAAAHQHAERCEHHVARSALQLLRYELLWKDAKEYSRHNVLACSNS